jgi:uncharacterized protein YdiU (UPF0061 family)
MEHFDPATVFSSIDRQGRYAWGEQPGIGQWNLTRLAEALLPLLAEEEDAAVERAQAALAVFGPAFNARFVAGFREKLGLEAVDVSATGTDDFLGATFQTLTEQRVDFTLFFRHLTRVASGQDADRLLSLFENHEAGEKWLTDWRRVAEERGGASPGRVETMRRVNPIFIPRNHRVEQAIAAGLSGDYAPFERLNAALARPFDEQPENADLEKAAEPGEIVERTFCGT